MAMERLNSPRSSVLILYSHNLLAETIRTVLGKDGIRSMARRADSPNLTERLRRMKPAVVIVEDSGARDILGSLLELEDHALVVRVSLSDSRMLYYQGNQTEASMEGLTRLVAQGLGGRVAGQESLA